MFTDVPGAMMAGDADRMICKQRVYNHQQNDDVNHQRGEPLLAYRVKEDEGGFGLPPSVYTYSN